MSTGLVVKAKAESVRTTTQGYGSAERYSFVFACLVVLAITTAAVRWILDHPYGIHWDEALYFDNVLRDIHNVYSGSLRQLASILIGGDIRRPPANLLVALPFLVVFGFHTAVARFVTLACWGISAWFIYLTTRRIASPTAGAVAALVFCLSPEVISASIFFSTEVALIAVPVLLITLFFARRRQPSLPTTISFIKAAALGVIIAAPWWLKNLGPALSYARFAREQPRNSLGAPSFVTWGKWFYTVVVSLIGPGLSILIGVVVILVVRKILVKKEVSFDPIQRTVLLTCLCALLPLVALQLSGTNHLLRYLCPAVIPFAIAVGVLSDATGWIRSRAAMVISGTLAFAQLAMIVAPVVFPNNRPVDPGFFNGGLPWRIMVRFDQWDWKPLRNIAQSCSLEKPKIAFLGMGRPLNPPQLLYPWFVAGASPSERNGFDEPLWLWRYEQGPVDWQKVMSLIGQSEVVVTAPGFEGQATDRQDFDNRDNREFAERVSRDPRFRGPIRLKMGRFDPVEVDVFLRNGLACSPDVQQAMR